MRMKPGKVSFPDFDVAYVLFVVIVCTFDVFCTFKLVHRLSKETETLLSKSVPQKLTERRMLVPRLPKRPPRTAALP